MIVWVYTNTAQEVGDEDHLKVFASDDAANAWFAEHDPGTRGVRCRTRSSSSPVRG